MTTATATTVPPNPAMSIRPPFTAETARAKVQAAEDGWNSRDPEPCLDGLQRGLRLAQPRRVLHRARRNRAFLRRKWEVELDYKLMKELWAFTDNRISVRFEYEWHDASGQWFRTHGNEHWEFNDDG